MTDRLWLGRPMVDGATSGPLTLREDTSRERWFVVLCVENVQGVPMSLHHVVYGSKDNIDESTRAWLAALAPVIEELRVGHGGVAHDYAIEPVTGIRCCRKCFVVDRGAKGWLTKGARELATEPACLGSGVDAEEDVEADVAFTQEIARQHGLHLSDDTAWRVLQEGMGWVGGTPRGERLRADLVCFFNRERSVVEAAIADVIKP